MTPRLRDVVDPLAAAAAAAALVVAGAYLGIMAAQDDRPLAWFAGGLTAAALLTGYGALRSVPGRRPVLVVSGAVLVGLGVVGLASIGCPVLVAGALALAAGIRRPAAGGRPRGRGRGSPARGRCRRC